MGAYTVYLFVRANGDHEPAAVTERRLQALQALRDELVRVGVRVTPLPGHADLDVEITNVFGTGDHSADAQRVLIVRISVGDHERLDFVCSDGLGRVSAEHHAAKRILVWLESLSHRHWGDPYIPRELTTQLMTDS